MNNQQSIDGLNYLHDVDAVYRDARWRTWLEVEAEINRRQLKSLRTDEILRPSLTAMTANPTPWTDILLLLCWQSLSSIHRLTRELDADAGRRWSSVMWHFTRVLRRLDQAARPEAIGRKIFNDVRHDMRLEFARELALAKNCCELADDLSAADSMDGPRPVVIGRVDRGFEDVDQCHDASWARAYLDSLVDRGIISETDRLILIGHHLYGETLERLAAKYGLTYEAARKRHQRAARFLAEHAKKDVPERRSRTPMRSEGAYHAKEER